MAALNDLLMAVGRLEGSTKALSDQMVQHKNENNANFRAQGERIGSLDTEFKGHINDLFSKYNTQSESIARLEEREKAEHNKPKNGNGRGSWRVDWNHPVAKYGGVGVGSVTAVELVKFLLAHLK